MLEIQRTGSIGSHLRTDYTQQNIKAAFLKQWEITLNTSFANTFTNIKGNTSIAYYLKITIVRKETSQES